jgi:hypothetical protein
MNLDFNTNAPHALNIARDRLAWHNELHIAAVNIHSIEILLVT